MLLFSTTLEINDNLTKEEFIRLVIRWNQTSPYSINVIPNLIWNGEYNIRYGSESLWLDIEEYRNKNILAVRFEKKDDDGAIWDTDFIMDYNSMMMAIQLDRTYTEEAQLEDLRFAVPNFIAMLIDGDYVKADNGLPVLLQAINITEENLNVLSDVINGKMRYHLPIVYISKTRNNSDPVNVSILCGILKGAAHILVQEDRKSNTVIRSACEDANEYFGGVGIYYPNGKHQVFRYRNYQGRDLDLITKITRAVYQYLNVQSIPVLSTWHGVLNSLITDRYEKKKAEKEIAELAKTKEENEKLDYIESFDNEIETLNLRIKELNDIINSLRWENQGLKKKLDNSQDVPILYLGEEEEFYQGEIKEMLLDAVAENLHHVGEKTRRADVLSDILKNNHYQSIREKREQRLKKLLIGYKTLSDSMRHELEDLGLVMERANNHYCVRYYGDARYQVTMSKTSSDTSHGDKNMVAEILNKMM